METIPELIAAIESRAWYPFAALFITILIGLWRKVQPTVWDKIPREVQWIPASVVAGLSAFVETFAREESWKVAIGVAVYALVAGALPAIGAAHVGKRVTPSKRHPTVTVGGLVFLALLASGCTASFEEARLVAPEQPVAAARDSGRCQSLDNQHRTWGAIAKSAAVLSGGTGLATIPSDSRELDIGLAIGSVGVGALAAAAIYVSETASESYVRECTE